MIYHEKKYLVFSVYSPELEDYPYFPFFADSISDGILKYHRFIDSKSKTGICENPELHLIGTCNKKDGIYCNIQPMILPQKVTFNNNHFRGLYHLTRFYVDKVTNYLQNLMLCRKR